MFPSLQQLVDDAAQAAGVFVPEEMPEETESKPISKSSRVRDYLEDHPGARNKDVSDALSDHGVRPADVANVKANLRKKEEKAGKKKKSAAVAAPAAPATNGVAIPAKSNNPEIDASIQIDLLETGVDFIRKAGGVNEALHVLGVIRRIRSL